MATPTSNGVVTTLSVANLSGLNYIDSLGAGTKWGGGQGSGANLTYSFGGAGSYYAAGYGYGEHLNGFGEFSATQKTATINALSAWAEVANITFSQVTDSISVAGDLRFAKSNVAAPTAYGYFPAATTEAGDVWFSHDSIYNTSTAGTYGNFTFIHEIGHALGLKHPHSTGGSGVVAATATDSTLYSVMSYKSYVGASVNAGYSQNYYATTPMLYDIAAIQHLYGANTTTRSGDTTYSWATGQQILQALWDAGGNDTIDWSNQTTAATINLNAGTYSELGPGYYNGQTTETKTLAIAYGVTIENATGGSAGDTITGNGVANTLQGLGGNDSLYGNAGDDILIGGLGADVLNGGSGTDTVSYVNATLGVAVLLNAGGGTGAHLGEADGDTFTSIENITGSSYSDYLVGDAAINVINAGSGDDALLGYGGNDTLLGFSGNDTMYGHDGNDSLHGHDGNDSQYGGAGNDVLFGHSGDDTLEGGTGADYMDGGSGTDTVSYASAAGGVAVLLNTGGSNGAHLGEADGDRFIGIENITGSAYADYLVGDDNANVVSAGSGNDAVLGNGGNDTLLGFSGNDTMYGHAGNDSLHGHDGNDTLIGGSGNDVLFGHSGDDTLEGGTGADYMDGGSGTDMVTYANATGGVAVLLNTGGADGAHLGEADGDRFNGIENITGSAYSDYLVGNDVANTIYGGTGDDALLGYGGNDTLLGNAGNDTLLGYSGDDTMYGHEGNDSLHGHDGNDTMYGGIGNDTLFGHSGDDTLEGGAGADYMDGGSGTDTVSYFNATMGVAVLLNTGGADGAHLGEADGDRFIGIENITGSAYADYLVGNDAGNVINAGVGNDAVFGGLGTDTLFGGAGGDTLSGGAGSDIFRYTSASDSTAAARDVISDFDATDSNEDLFFDGLLSGVFSWLGSSLNAFTNSGNTQARFDDATDLLQVDTNGDATADLEITLTGVALADLDSTDFTVT